ncbi:hypothetical protein QUB61_10960 [Microcoleus sp. C2D2]
MQQLEKDILYLYEIKSRLAELRESIPSPPEGEFDGDKDIACTKGYEHAELLIRNLRAIQRYLRGQHGNDNQQTSTATPCRHDARGSGNTDPTD